MVDTPQKDALQDRVSVLCEILNKKPYYITASPNVPIDPVLTSCYNRLAARYGQHAAREVDVGVGCV
jgi:hypothetical protein